MKVKTLITEFKEYAKSGKKYDLAAHIKKSYLPYVEKMSLASRAINSTSYVEINGVSVYKQNTPAMMMFFDIGLIEAYTDLVFDVSKVSNDYDLMIESGIMASLLSLIPENEQAICRDILQMTRNDLLENTRSLVSYIETKSDAFVEASNALTDVLANITPTE